MKTLCLGGSFNPIHHGHLICARAVMERAGYERVMIIPSAQPPHKPAHANLAPAVDRLRMCQLAVQGSATFVVDDIELKRTGPSYTIDTAAELKQAGRTLDETLATLRAELAPTYGTTPRMDGTIRAAYAQAP